MSLFRSLLRAVGIALITAVLIGVLVVASSLFQVIFPRWFGFFGPTTTILVLLAFAHMRRKRRTLRQIQMNTTQFARDVSTGKSEQTPASGENVERKTPFSTLNLTPEYLKEIRVEWSRQAPIIFPGEENKTMRGWVYILAEKSAHSEMEAVILSIIGSCLYSCLDIPWESTSSLRQQISDLVMAAMSSSDATQSHP